MGAAVSRAYDAPEMRSLPPLVASLARIPFFAGLDEDALERLAAGTRIRRFRRGAVIERYHTGEHEAQAEDGASPSNQSRVRGSQSAIPAQPSRCR